MSKREFTFEVWCEGYLATGMEGRPVRASLMGTMAAPTFEEACNRLLGGDTCFDEKQLTHWGCRLYPSEAEARLSFG